MENWQLCSSTVDTKAGAEGKELNEKYNSSIITLEMYAAILKAHLKYKIKVIIIWADHMQKVTDVILLQLNKLFLKLGMAK